MMWLDGYRKVFGGRQDDKRDDEADPCHQPAAGPPPRPHRRLVRRRPVVHDAPQSSYGRDFRPPISPYAHQAQEKSLIDKSTSLAMHNEFMHNGVLAECPRNGLHDYRQHIVRTREVPQFVVVAWKQRTQEGMELPACMRSRMSNEVHAPRALELDANATGEFNPSRASPPYAVKDEQCDTDRERRCTDDGSGDD